MSSGIYPYPMAYQQLHSLYAAISCCQVQGRRAVLQYNYKVKNRLPKVAERTQLCKAMQLH